MERYRSCSVLSDSKRHPQKPYSMGPKKKWHHQQQLKRTTEQQQATDSTTAAEGIAGQEHEQRAKKRRVSSIGLAQVKGHQAVVGTCDVRNDRAATAELIDLLNTVADDMYPEEEGETRQDPPATASGVDEGQHPATPGDTAAAALPAPASLSVEEMVRQEADALRSGQDKSHRFKSVNTFVKGVIMVCVMDPRVDVVRLVDALFAEIRTTRKRRSRLLERVTPLQVTSFSEIEAFTIAAQPAVFAALPRVAEGVPPLAPVAAPKKAVGADTAPAEEVAAVPASHGGGEEAAASAAAATAAEDSTSAKDAARSGSVCIAGKREGGQAAEDAAVTGDGGPGEKGAAPKATGASNGGTAPKADARKEEQAGAAVDAAAAGDEGVIAEDCRDSGKTCDRRWKFRVDVRRRNSGLKRLELINAVAGSVGKGHSVSMASPDVSVMQGNAPTLTVYSSRCSAKETRMPARPPDAFMPCMWSGTQRVRCAIHLFDP